MNNLSGIRSILAGLPAQLGGLGARKSTISASEMGELNGSLPSSAARPAQDGSFSQMLGTMVRDVNASQASATQAVGDLQSGQNVSLHQAMIAMEEASVSFQLMVEVRNKLMESYQELMRMQV